MLETVICREQKPLHRVVRGRTVHKGESSWTKGIWLGRAEESTEHVIGTADMVTRARTVRRLEPTKRADRELLARLSGVPWNAGGAKRGRPAKPQGVRATAIPQADQTIVAGWDTTPAPHVPSSGWRPRQSHQCSFMRQRRG